MRHFFYDARFLTTHHYVNSQNTIKSFEDIVFLSKNLSNFVSLLWKLYNPYCHSTAYCPNIYTVPWIEFFWQQWHEGDVDENSGWQWLKTKDFSFQGWLQLRILFLSCFYCSNPSKKKLLERRSAILLRSGNYFGLTGQSWSRNWRNQYQIQMSS